MPGRAGLVIFGPVSETTPPETEPLSAIDRAIVDEEESLLARARAVVDAAIARAAERAPVGDGMASVEVLRGLRDDAVAARAEDLPGILHEMTVRSRFVGRAPEVLPDPASPYLAHLRVREGKQTKDYLLGRASLIEAKEGVRIVDWRVAPVARIFYRHREGDAYEEEMPGRVAEGVVEARRILVIEDGQLMRILGDGLALVRGPDGAWTRTGSASLSQGGAGTAARPGILGTGVGQRDQRAFADITALLDTEQFEAVHAPADQPLLVLGSAGSGKTTVALHRLSRIATASPDVHPLSRTRVVVPEEGLARLSRRLLAPLGASGAQVQTLDDWATSLARQVFGELPPVWLDAPGLVVSLKRHPALYRALRSRWTAAPIALAGATQAVALRRLRKRLAELLSDRAFLGAVVDDAGGTLPRSAIEETVRHTMDQIADTVERQIARVVVREKKRAVDGRSIAEGTPEEKAGTIDVEDLPLLLFAASLAQGGDALGALDADPIAHLVVDEAEDVSLFELSVLSKQLREPHSVTLAGDEAQQTSSCFAGWKTSLGALSASDAAVCRLAVSYRCPRPIAAFARGILGHLAHETQARTARDGAPVETFAFPDGNQAQLFVVNAVVDLAAREPRASVAIVARDADAARALYALLEDRKEARLVVGGDFSFDPGIDVTHVDSVKGLEFDYVVVPDATAIAYPDDDDARRTLHVAATRAAHQLWLVAGGPPSPLLAPAALAT